MSFNKHVRDAVLAQLDTLTDVEVVRVYKSQADLQDGQKPRVIVNIGTVNRAENQAFENGRRLVDAYVMPVYLDVGTKLPNDAVEAGINNEFWDDLQEKIIECVEDLGMLDYQSLKYKYEPYQIAVSLINNFPDMNKTGMTYTLIFDLKYFKRGL